MLQICSVLYFLLGFFIFGEAQLPSGWKACKKDLPDRNECLKQAISGAIKSLTKSGMFGLPPLEPLKSGLVEVKGSSRDGKMKLQNVYKDLYLYNMKDTIIHEAKVDGNHVLFKGEIPAMPALSPCKVKGTAMGISVDGEGVCDFTFNVLGLKCDLTFANDPVVRDGKKYLALEKFEVRYSLKGLVMDFDIFNGNEHKRKDFNKIMNDNWSHYWEVIKPGNEKTFSEKLGQITGLIFSQIPMEELQLL